VKKKCWKNFITFFKNEQIIILPKLFTKVDKDLNNCDKMINFYEKIKPYILDTSKHHNLWFSMEKEKLTFLSKRSSKSFKMSFKILGSKFFIVLTDNTKNIKKKISIYIENPTSKTGGYCYISKLLPLSHSTIIEDELYLLKIDDFNVGCNIKTHIEYCLTVNKENNTLNLSHTGLNSIYCTNELHYSIDLKDKLTLIEVN